MLPMPGTQVQSPGQGTRSHMLQLRACMPQLRQVKPNEIRKKEKLMLDSSLSFWPGHLVSHISSINSSCLGALDSANTHSTALLSYVFKGVDIWLK